MAHHVANGHEWGIYSDGFVPLLNVQGGTGSVKIRGGLNADGGITTTNLQATTIESSKINAQNIQVTGNVNAPNLATKEELNSLVSSGSVANVKANTMWCADGDICNLPTGKINIQFPNRGDIRAKERLHLYSDRELYLLPKNGTIIGKEWGGNGNLTVQGNAGIHGGLTMTGGKLLTPPGANLCNSNGTICVDVVQIKDVIDNAARKDQVVNLTDKYSVEHYNGRGALRAGDLWDARTANSVSDWEKWVFRKQS
jgi:hypothetical protein